MKLIALACLVAASAALHALALAGGSQSCSAKTLAGDTRQGDFVSTAVAAGNFKALATALQAAGLVDTLKGAGPFTVFAPTDEAFAKIPRGTLNDLLKPEDKQKLVDVLTCHLVPGKVLAADIVKIDSTGTVNGQRADVRVVEGSESIDGANVTKTDNLCSNSVIHAVDAVILPGAANLVETAQRAGTLGTLLAAAKAAGLADTLAKGGPLTILAPTDEAFAKRPAGTVQILLKPENKEKLAAILKLHVIQGRVYADQVVGLTEASALAGRKLAVNAGRDDVTISGAKVTATDVEAKDGVIHVTDTVILPG